MRSWLRSACALGGIVVVASCSNIELSASPGDGVDGGTGGGDGGGGEAGTADGGPTPSTPCTRRSDCPVAPECNIAECIAGACTTRPAPSGVACSKGVCSGAGSCGECVPTYRGCSNNAPRTCTLEGKWETETAPCAGATPLCGDGRCVAEPPSCAGLASDCGPTGTDNCCARSMVEGGSFLRSNSASAPASISSFVLDRYEVSVGRFRRFVDAYPAGRPQAGDGAHPLIPNSGWNASWPIPADKNLLAGDVKCTTAPNPGPTWVDSAQGKESVPINCVSWYVAFAFCAWDGGWLPTEAEWNYAAAGGDQQRQYPWGSAAASTAYAVYTPANTVPPLGVVGSKSPTGDGRWGQADLAGNVAEWTLDWHVDPYVPSCTDCANLASGTDRVLRGARLNMAYAPYYLETSYRQHYAPATREAWIGFRCARRP